MSHETDLHAPQPSVFSSGYLVFRRSAQLQFLLMRHHDRWDLPKGHLDPGETKAEAAVRELQEETGLAHSQIWTDPNFVFEHRYWVNSRKTQSHRVLKELTIYLGFLHGDGEIRCTEHPDYRWWDWSPPHRIQIQTIDPLLSYVENHLQGQADVRRIFQLS